MCFLNIFAQPLQKKTDDDNGSIITVQLRSSNKPAMCLTAYSDDDFAPVIFSKCIDGNLNQAFFMKKEGQFTGKIHSFSSSYSGTSCLHIEDINLMEQNSVIMNSKCTDKWEVLQTGALRHVQKGKCIGWEEESNRTVAVECDSVNIETWVAIDTWYVSPSALCKKNRENVGLFSIPNVQEPFLFTSYFQTPDQYQYMPVKEFPEESSSSGHVLFSVQANNDVHIALGVDKQQNGLHYEIVLGGLNNSHSLICIGNQDSYLAEYSGPVLRAKRYVMFRISWDENILKVESSSGCNTSMLKEIMKFEDRGESDFNYEIKDMMIATAGGATGKWQIFNGRCVVSNPFLIGDGICNGGAYNTEACSFDGGDCLLFPATFSSPLVPSGQFSQTFLLINPDSQKVLDIHRGTCEDRTNIQLFGRHGNPNQQFHYHFDTQAIVSVKCDMAIDISGFNCNDGTNLWLHKRNGRGSQKFRFYGDHTIGSLGCDGKVIDIASSGTSTSGSNIHLWTKRDDRNQQKWHVVYV